MKQNIYSIKDTLVGFGVPFTMLNDAVAIRGFEGMAKAQTPNNVNTYPENKELWCLGEFDTDTGKINPIEPLFKVRASEYVGG